MKTANLQHGHATDITRGRANPHRSTARGITTRDATTDVEPVTDITFVGATVTDGGDGSAIVTIGGSPGIGSPPWYDVVDDYGATGDGTTDDTTAINNAIAAINSAGCGVLYFPCGTYLVSAGLTAITAPCLVLGDGRAGLDAITGSISEIHFTHATQSLFTVSSENVSFRGLALYCSATATAGAGITVSGGGNMALYEWLSVVGFYVNIDIQEGAIWAMRDCYIRQSHKYGVKIRNVSTPDGGDWSMVGCYLTDGANSSDAAIRIESGGGGRISSCKVNGNSSGFNHGIDVAIPNGVNTSDLQLENNSIENFRGDGIRVITASGGTFGHVTMVGNQVAADVSFNTTGNGIVVTANTAGDLSGGAIVGNVIQMNGTGTSSGSAIKLTKADRFLVANNIVADATANYAAGLSQSGCTNIFDYTGGIAAGVSITGTPSSGDVPLASSGTAAAWGPPPTGSVATDAIWDAAGDLAIGTGANTAAKLTIGSTRTILKSNGTTATWTLPSFIGCVAVANANTTLTNANTEYAVALAGTDEIDTDGYHDPTTNNSRITVPTGLAGIYGGKGYAYVPVADAAGAYVDLKIRKNGAAGTVLGQVRVFSRDGNTIAEVEMRPTSLVATDYIELYAMNSGAGNTAQLGWLSLEYLGTT